MKHCIEFGVWNRKMMNSIVLDLKPQSINLFRLAKPTLATSTDTPTAVFKHREQVLVVNANKLSNYDSFLQGCLNTNDLPEGKIVHAHIIQTRFNSDVVLDTKLVTLYAKCGFLADARQVFDEMPERNVVSWTAMIAAYSKYGHTEGALKLFYQMQEAGIRPNQFTFASVLPAFAWLASLERAKEVHGEIMKSGLESNLFVGSALVDLYVKCGDMGNARDVFDKMLERNVVTWTTLIAAYARNGDGKEALRLYNQMQRTGIKPSFYTFTGVLMACADMTVLEHGKEIHKDIITSGLQSNAFVGSALVDMYVKCESIDDAQHVFDKIRERNVVCWTALIAGYVQNKQFGDSLELIQQMQRTNIRLDLETYSTILTVCGNLAALQGGKEVHGDIIRGGWQLDVFVESALVDMYAKCGSLEDACKVFEKMPERDVVSWTAMIVGYAMHGCGQEALQLFKQMRHCSVKPNRVTFLGALSACCHAGLLDDGWQCFNSMARDYGIRPDVEHYGCIVDLLGRSGHLDDAYDFINKMPIKPDNAVWGSLLSACRIHTNVELAERAAQHLFVSDPKNASHYVLLSNIYAAAGRWDGIEEVRKLMRERKVKKMPGYSWIEVNNRVHSFIAGDRSHPQTEKIYENLESLYGQMKDAGYAPDTDFVFHDLEKEQKEHALCYHSEKLAIAFGLITAVTSIIVVKNLRICGDCHSATKLISKIVARDIVVRDAKRFHRFKDGQCSCGDYW